MQILLQLINPEKIFIPGAISPNGDGNNDLLIIYAGPEVVREVSFDVFSRWGEIVYHRQDFLPNDPAYAWDGTFNGEKLDPGVFICQVEIEFLDGSRSVLAGDVLVIH